MTLWPATSVPRERFGGRTRFADGPPTWTPPVGSRIILCVVPRGRHTIEWSRGEFELLVADANVRIIRGDGELLGKVTPDPKRRYFGAAAPVHNVLRQVSVMS